MYYLPPCGRAERDFARSALEELTDLMAAASIVAGKGGVSRQSTAAFCRARERTAVAPSLPAFMEAEGGNFKP